MMMILQMTMALINSGTSIMKNIFKYVALAAIAATAFVSCQEELTTPDQPEAPEVGEVQIKVTAVPQALAGAETRTYISNNTILWGTGEYMKLAVQAGENTTFATSTDASADSFSGQAQATFSFSVTPGDASSYTYMGLYPASAASTSSNTNPANYKVNLPAIQNATASSYDPAAYIMVTKSETFNNVETEWTASYRRATALNKITLKNLPDGVSINKVKITAEGKKLAGGRHFNLTTGEGLEVYGTDATIEVLYATALTGTNVDVWFTSWDAEIAEGEKLTIVAYTTDNKSYTKSITARTEGIKFKEGYLNTLGASFTNITPDGVTKLEDGDYVILAKHNTSYYALKGEASSTRIASVDYTGSTTSFEGDASLVWTIATSGTGYTIKNGGNYVGWTSGNSADLVAEADYDAAKCLMAIEEDGDVYHIKVSADQSRVLAKNTGSAYFAFYASTGQYADIVFVPATALAPVSTPTFSPAAGEVTSGTEVTISTTTDGATIYYTTDGSDPTTSSTQGNTVTITSATTIKAIAVKDGMTNSEVATALYTIAGVINYPTLETSNVTLTAGTNGSEATVNDNDAIKVGTSSKGGDMSLTVPAGTTKLHVHAAAWNGVTGLSLNISGATCSPASIALSADSGIANSSPFTLNGNPEDFYFELTLSNITSDTKITFTSSIAKRFVVWGVNSEAAVDDRQDAGIVWKKAGNETSTDTASLEDDDDVLPTTALYNPNNVTVTYASSNTNVATIDGSGTITLVSAGETTISAVFEGNDTYKPATVEYTLSVTDNSSTSPTLKYTLDGTDSSQGSNGYATESVITQSSIGWIAVANTTINPWRFGGKNLDGVDRAVYSTTPIASNISSIEVESGTANATVHSLTITVHNSSTDAANGNNAIATKSVTTGITSSTVTLTKTDATSWAGKYYRIAYNVTAGGSNSYVQFVSAKFYGTN